jgi:hypothetical protein
LAKAKVLIYDIETSPLETYTWGIYDQNVAPNQIKKDWHLLSFAAKWLGEKGVIYHDQSKAKDITNDKKLLERLWSLLDEADIVITQNGKAFDQKKVYARFIYHGMNPPSPSKHIDTKQIAKKNFGFTSNGLAYLTEKLGVTKKSEHSKFPGMELWRQCLAGNKAAWAEMKKYNIQDVLALEAVYNKLRVWDTSVNITLDGEGCRSCGGLNLQRRGYDYTAAGKQQRFQCTDCGSWCKSGENLLSKDERLSIKRRA